MTRLPWRPLAVLVVVAGVWALLHLGWFTHGYAHGHLQDTVVYERYGRAVVHRHEVPYRDFRPEYPPAALPMFIVPALFAHSSYVPVFQALMVCCLAAAALAVLGIAGIRAALATAVLPLFVGALVLSRFDLWPAALTVLALAALLRDRRSFSAILLGTAFAAKLWPALLAPLAVVWLFRHQGRAAARRWLGLAVAAAAVWFVPFAILAPGGLGHSFERQLGRPLQIESLGAAVLLAAHRVFGISVGHTFAYGSTNIGGAYVDAVGIATTVVEVVALVAVFLWFLRSRTETNDLLRAFAALVTVSIAFGKVFSPQFLIWLFPLVPLVRGRRGQISTVLLFLACVLTQLYFPTQYKQYSQYFYARPELEVLARDIVVVLLGVALVAPLPARVSARRRLGTSTARA